MIFSFASFWLLLRDQLTQTSALEWFGTITGFFCVYLAAKQHILNWPVAILSILAYMILFYQYKLYGDAALQLYFLLTSVYGWHYWLKGKGDKSRPVVSLNGKQYLGLIVIVLIFSVLLGSFLDRFTNTDVPYIDAACTAMSFAAQLLMTRKVLQNWILWIVVDICYIPLYLYKNLALTAVLYTLYLALAAMGYIDWKRTWKQSAQ